MNQVYYDRALSESRHTVVGWFVSKNTGWRPNHRYLWVWPYLEKGSLQGDSSSEEVILKENEPWIQRWRPEKRRCKGTGWTPRDGGTGGLADGSQASTSHLLPSATSRDQNRRGGVEQIPSAERPQRINSAYTPISDLASRNLLLQATQVVPFIGSPEELGHTPSIRGAEFPDVWAAENRGSAGPEAARL